MDYPIRLTELERTVLTTIIKQLLDDLDLDIKMQERLGMATDSDAVLQEVLQVIRNKLHGIN